MSGVQGDSKKSATKGLPAAGAGDQMPDLRVGIQQITAQRYAARLKYFQEWLVAEGLPPEQHR
eukprot:1175123-Amphidinium_carterae.1